MRRIWRTSLAAITVTAVALWATITPAAASTSSLTVTTLGRDGSAVRSIVSVVSLTGPDTHLIATGTAFVLPAGDYAVLADVKTTSDASDTLGASIVTVAGSTTTTIDARLGHPLNVALDSGPGAGYTQRLFANICAPDRIGDIEAFGSPGAFYVIPNPSSRLRLAYMSTWQPTAQPSDTYAVSAVSTGLPTSPGGVFAGASLATVTAHLMRGPSAGPVVDFSLQPRGTVTYSSCQSGLFDEVYMGPAPYSVIAHVSPGKWILRSDMFMSEQGVSLDIGHWNNKQTLSAAEAYTANFYHAAWGPTTNLPTVRAGTVNFDATSMFGDPYPVNIGTDKKVSANTTLTFKGKIISSGTAPTFSAPITTAGWYTLKTTAGRHEGLPYPPGLLSPKDSALFHFYADPAAAPTVPPVFLTRFVPAGLDLSDRAAPNTTTNVALQLDHAAQASGVARPAAAALNVAAWASYDDGATWHATTIVGNGSTWTAVVHNPASGTVSLRATVSDAAGNSARVTINRAYGIR